MHGRLALVVDSTARGEGAAFELKLLHFAPRHRRRACAQGFRWEGESGVGSGPGSPVSQRKKGQSSAPVCIAMAMAFEPTVGLSPPIGVTMGMAPWVMFPMTKSSERCSRAYAGPQPKWLQSRTKTTPMPLASAISTERAVAILEMAGPSFFLPSHTSREGVASSTSCWACGTQEPERANSCSSSEKSLRAPCVSTSYAAVCAAQLAASRASSSSKPRASSTAVIHCWKGSGSIR